MPKSTPVFCAYEMLNSSNLYSTGRLTALLVTAVGLLFCACATSGASYKYQTAATAPRDPLAAQNLNRDGLRAVEDGDLETAERQFRGAIEHDLYYAPAHNNLGLVLMQRQRFYEAAWEFNYAARLAPESPEPRDNLGILFESVGRLDQAVEHYQDALEVAPDNLSAMRHLARAYVKTGRKDRELKTILEKLLAVPHDRQWDVWLRGQLIRVGRPEPPES